MSNNNQYLQAFFTESEEYIQILNKNILALENNPENREIIDSIFRAAHSLKGMAATMGFDSLTDLTHKLENVLDRVRAGKLKISTKLIDLLFSGLDHIEDLISQIKETGKEDKNILDYLNKMEGYIQTDKAKLKDKICDFTNLNINQDDFKTLNENMKEEDIVYQVIVTIYNHSSLKNARNYMVLKLAKSLGYLVKSKPEKKQIEANKFEGNVIQFILLSDKPIKTLQTELESINDVKDVKLETVDINSLRTTKKKRSENKELASLETSTTVRVDIDKLDKLMNLVGELLINKTRLESLHIAASKTTDILSQLDRVTMELHHSVMQIRMVPVKTTFNRFPRMMRDLSKELNKEINFIMEGEETELDRSIIDELSDPLTHLLRNSLDHGIESSDERENKGKDSQGTIALRAYQKGSEIIIKVEDDGAGIDENKLLEKAVANNVVTAEEAEEMDKHDKLQLIFAAGLSTVEEVSDVSGRGVGMDVVKRTVEDLDGQVYIESEKNEGTKVTISLPLTLAIAEALMVKINKETFALPLNTISETLKISTDEIKRIRGNAVINFRDKTIPLVDSRMSLNISVEKDLYNKRKELEVVIVNSGGRLIGLIVDELLHQQEIVIKSLGDFLDSVKNISGATIIGDGEVALILDVRDIA